MIRATSILIENLEISYENKPVLKNINLSILAGQFVAIMGRSGVGKTSLLNAIANFIPYTGKINKVDTKIGFCFQGNSLFYWKTIAQNIGFGLEPLDRDEKVMKLLEKIGLQDYADKYPFELSGGQIQRVALARAMANRPSILLLDEPLSNLDVDTRDQMIEWILNFISEYSVTVLMNSHYLDEALIFSDRIIVLENGKIKKDIIIDLKKPRKASLKFKPKFLTFKKKLSKTLYNGNINKN